MPEPLQVFTFGMAVPDLSVVGHSVPEKQAPTMEVVITPGEGEEPPVVKGPQRRQQETSEQRKKP